MPQANHATAMTPPLAVVLLFCLHNLLIAQTHVADVVYRN